MWDNPYAIDIDKIKGIIIGLKTYEANIDDKRLKRYIEWSRSDKEPDVGIWKIIWAVVLLLLNIVGKQIKNDYIEEYQFRKVVESFFRMQPKDYVHVEDFDPRETFHPMEAVSISNKQQLYSYTMNDFSKMFFTEGQHV